jgi:hypothetical protein
MAQVRLLGGKPLMVGGKVALNDDCCCGGDEECSTCDHTHDIITLTPSGLSICSGCISSAFYGQSYNTLADLGINNSAVLGRIDGPPSPDYWQGNGGSVSFNYFLANTTCSGLPSGSFSHAVQWNVICDETGYRIIGIFSTWGVVFYAREITGSCTVSNQLSCNLAVGDAYFGAIVGAASGGTVNLAFS